MASPFSCVLNATAAGSGEMLCAAVRSRLPAHAAHRYELEVGTATDTFLEARLSRKRGATLTQGPQIGLSIVDRTTFPQESIDRFADELIQSLPEAE